MRFKSERKVMPERVASKDASRPVLSKVHLDADRKEGAQVVVTDSYMLARFPVELDEGDTSGPIPVEALKASRKPPTKYGGDVAIRANSHVEVAQGETAYMTLPREELDYTFPNADQLIPSNLAEFRVGLDAAKLHALAKALGDETVILHFVADADGNPRGNRVVYVTTTHDPKGESADGILMPIWLASV